MIYTEDQLVKVNGVVLPGLVKSIEVKESAKIDEQEVEGSATKPKQATGYEDAKVNIELILDDTPTATKYQRLETVRALFRTPGQSVPQPIPIVSEDTAKHGIDKVLFKGITHKSEVKKDQLTVSLCPADNPDDEQLLGEFLGRLLWREDGEPANDPLLGLSEVFTGKPGEVARRGRRKRGGGPGQSGADAILKKEAQRGDTGIILPADRGAGWPLYIRPGRRD